MLVYILNRLAYEQERLHAMEVKLQEMDQHFFEMENKVAVMFEESFQAFMSKWVMSEVFKGFGSLTTTISF